MREFRVQIKQKNFQAYYPGLMQCNFIARLEIPRSGGKERTFWDPSSPKSMFHLATSNGSAKAEATKSTRNNTLYFLHNSPKKR
jgi:hypothetical protein